MGGGGLEYLGEGTITYTYVCTFDIKVYIIKCIAPLNLRTLSSTFKAWEIC